MQPNRVIISQDELLNHFGSSQKLEICDLMQMQKLLEMNIPSEVWEDASNRNLLSFSQEFVQGTQEFTLVFNYNRKIENFHLNFISNLSNLTELNLSENQISDISSICKLKNLKKLVLAKNCIEDISSLQSLTDLTQLDLFENKLTSYTLALPNLVELQLGYNKLQEKYGIQHSPKLEILNLSYTETVDLNTISQLFSLKVLKLRVNNISNIAQISNFVDLRILSLGYNQLLQNIVPLKFCTQLAELSISGTSVVDIWPLQFMKNLKTFDMANTKVIDLHPLQNLYKLEDFSAHRARIIDISLLIRFLILQLQQNHKQRYSKAPQEFFKI
ncbi:Conserved_hypothetical protein [Hexamita inflata]|uniref:Uncharacterized protein n=1 Tax=Hexamita inflata TaxID=28002 RepID=A0AA86Q4V2_9EUKA|nr:Conserved hypothetical protein [Hexamita inflata]